MAYEVAHFINGKSFNIDNKTLDIYNPAIGKVIGHLNVADKETVNKSVIAAKSAFQSWSQTTPAQRAKIAASKASP